MNNFIIENFYLIFYFTPMVITIIIYILYFTIKYRKYKVKDYDFKGYKTRGILPCLFIAFCPVFNFLAALYIVYVLLDEVYKGTIKTISKRDIFNLR